MHSLAIFESQRAFRKAALYETYKKLKLDKILMFKKTAQEVSYIFDFNREATERFLNALVTLNILVFSEDKKYIINNFNHSYSNRSSLILFSLVQKKIVDIFVDGPKSLNEIIKVFGPSEGCELFLEEAVFYKLLEKNDIMYSIPDENKKLLFPNSKEYIGDLVEYLEKIAMPTFNVESLIGALKSGQSQWRKYINTYASHPFLFYKEHPEIMKNFTRGLHKLNEEDNQLIVKQLPLRNIKTVLDVGGGSGALALELLKQSEEISTVDIYELPEAIPILKLILDEYSEDSQKVNFISGSFLNNNTFLLDGLSQDRLYDLIILSWVLHDWTDETNIEILKKTVFHLNKNGKIIVLESILSDDRVGSATLSDVTMLLHTEGKERTFSEYKNFLEVAGFKEVTLIPGETKRRAIVAYK